MKGDMTMEMEFVTKIVNEMRPRISNTESQHLYDVLKNVLQEYIIEKRSADQKEPDYLAMPLT